MGKLGIKTLTFIICDSRSRHLHSRVLLPGTGQAKPGLHRVIQKNVSAIAKKWAYKLNWHFTLKNEIQHIKSYIPAPNNGILNGIISPQN